MDIKRRKFIKLSAAALAAPPASWLFQSVGLARAEDANSHTIDLAGTWQVQLPKQGAWVANAATHQASLPGSLTSNGLGDDVALDTPWLGFTGRGGWATEEKYAPYRKPDNIKVPFWLQPDKYYQGVAWYKRTVHIPDDWAGKRIHLELERCHWETSVLVDGAIASSIDGKDSLCVPHLYDLSDLLTPGEHELLIGVDNHYHTRVGYDAHSVTDHTQTNWNGIVGHMTLTAHDSVYIEDVQVYPDAANRRAKVVVHIANYTADEAVIELSIEASFGNKRSQTHTLTAAQQQFEITYDFGADAPLWDEFTPNLIDMRVSLFSDSATDEKLLQIGLRDIRTQGRTFLVNGRPTMMRGTLDCAVFPLTGYPSTDVKEWQRIFNVAKSYGLNHIRFHSWCPPKAAFIAGDIEGMYLQPEAPIWRGTCPFTEAKPVYPFLNKESERILKAYGNHACFVMFVHGNEPWELDMEWLDTVWVPAMKKRDPRRLICAGAHYPIGKHSDFHLPGVTDGFTLRYHQSFDTPPSTQRTYEEQIQTQNIPCIAHETGQWCVFPNLKEIDKYTGCLQPNNFRIVKDFLRQNHLLEQAEDFLHASGKFQTLIYKESNEAFLRTREMGGYQLLGLNDFPGQGTAMVGVVDVFWENKGYVTPQAFRRFNGSVVPLALMDKFVWTNNETFSADIRIAQYSHSTLHDIATEWELVNNQNEPIASGMFKQQDIPIGNTQTLGKLSIPLSEIKHACQLTLRVKLTGTDYQNHWHLWVYPNVSEQKPPEKIVFSAQRDDAIKALQAGKTVLFAPGPRAFAGNTHGTFAPIFWNKAWFPAQKEHTLGLLCSPNHPALTHFPTDFHADFQWHDLMMQSKPIIMDGLDPNLKPIVQPIDDWNTCRRLGLVFEAKVGKGRLLLTSIDLSNDIQNRPVARQMRRSLMHYMAGEAFSPAHTLSVAQLNALVPKRPLHDLQASISASSSATGHESINVLDTNPSTFWQSHNKETGHGYPHHLILDLNTITAVQALRFLPRQDGASEGWVKTIRLFVSDNKKQWRHVKQAPLSNNQEWKQVDMPVSTRFVKIELVSPHDSNHTSASFAELDIVIRTKK